MRRLARRLFTMCSALSLVLCVALCVLWVRSYRTGDAIPLRFAGEPWRLTSRGGWVEMDNEPAYLDEQAAWSADATEQVRQLTEDSKRDLSKLKEIWRGAMPRELPEHRFVVRTPLGSPCSGDSGYFRWRCQPRCVPCYPAPGFAEHLCADSGVGAPGAAAAPRAATTSAPARNAARSAA